MFQYSGLSKPLPEHIHLLTLEQWEKKSLLLRLEHIYQNNEDTELSQPKEISLKVSLFQSSILQDLFSGFTIDSVKELTLGANRNQSNAYIWPRSNRRFRSRSGGKISRLQHTRNLACRRHRGGAEAHGDQDLPAGGHVSLRCPFPFFFVNKSFSGRRKEHCPALNTVGDVSLGDSKKGTYFGPASHGETRGYRVINRRPALSNLEMALISHGRFDSSRLCFCGPGLF